MRRSCAPLLPMALCVAAASVSSHGALAAYSTPSGAKPDLQAKQLVDAQVRAIGQFTEICRDASAASGRYDQIADILAAALSASFAANPSVTDLSAQDDDHNQIVLGDLASPSIAALATALKRNTSDLGTEGYDLVALPNPASTNGSWIVLILADGPQGVLRGVYSLVDLIQSASGDVTNLRVRDYPDWSFRGLMHWLPPLPNQQAAIETWAQNQRAGIELVAGWGANALTLGRSEFWKMGMTVGGTESVGARMAEVAYWARYYGMEAVPEVGSPLPSADPLWREGAFIRDEPFQIQASLEVDPLIEPYDNDAYNFDFEDADTGNPPFAAGWQQNGGGAQHWVYGQDSRGHYLSYDGFGKMTLEPTWTTNPLQPGCFYVLECHFHHVTYGISNGSPPENQYMTLGVRGTLPGGGPYWFLHDYIRRHPGNLPNTPFVEDYYFWTPPSAAQAASDPRYEGYPGPFFEDLTDIQLWIYNSAEPFEGPQPISMQIDELFLERRATSLRNVMWTQGTGADLEFTVTSDEADPGQRTVYSEGTDYTLTYVPSPLFAMPTRKYDANGNFLQEYISTLTWLDPQDVGKTVLVSYTLGVPDDWNLGQQARTWCLKSPELRAAVKNQLRKFYEPWSIDPHDSGTPFSYTIDPAYLEVNVSEFRGANRCGRCVEANDDNGMYFAHYIKDEVAGILDELAQESCCAAAGETDLLLAGSFGPGTSLTGVQTSGEQDEYQFRPYGGRYGKSALFDEELAYISSPTRRMIFEISNGNCKTLATCNAGEYASRALGWPYAYGSPANVYVVAANNSDTGAPAEHTASGRGVYDASTWNLPDCLGFYSIGPGYASEDTVLHEETEQKLMDYAWRRYANPDATLHAQLNGVYLTDDMHDATVSIAGATTLGFLPFGSSELRDPATSNYVVTAASIQWGSGTPVNVLNLLNKGQITHTFGKGTRPVTLTVQATPQGGGTPVSRQAIITVAGPSGGGGEPDPDGKLTVAVPFGIRLAGPNPFNPTTRIEFGLAQNSQVRLEVLDLRGRRVVELVGGEILAAGVHSREWNGRDSRGRSVASGSYLVRLAANGQVDTRKILLVE